MMYADVCLHPRGATAGSCMWQFDGGIMNRVPAMSQYGSEQQRDPLSLD
jgi:hypothetical protein